MALKTFKTFLEEDKENLQELAPLLAAIPALLGKAGAGLATFAGTKAGASVLASAGGAAAEKVLGAVLDKKPQMASAGGPAEAGTVQNVSVGGSRGTMTSNGSMVATTDGKPVGTTNRIPLAGSPADMAARGFPQQPGRNIARIGAY